MRSRTGRGGFGTPGAAAGVAGVTGFGGGGAARTADFVVASTAGGFPDDGGLGGAGFAWAEGSPDGWGGFGEEPG